MPIAECPDCGAKLSNGLCPRCLVKLGIDATGPARREAGSTFDLPARPGSVLETIGATIGGRASRPAPRHRPRRGALADRPAHATAIDTSTRYRIDGEIARGGMGAILKGRDPDLGRDVAVKVLREDHRDNADLVRRFVEEAQIGGQLQHPGVVPIYELGTFADRRPFFSMKLVKGQTLADLLAARPTPGRRPAPVPVDLRGDRPDDGLRPRPRRDPPRPEAVERDGRPLRRGPGDGLGPGQGPAPGRRGRRREGRQGEAAGDR